MPLARAPDWTTCQSSSTLAPIPCFATWRPLAAIASASSSSLQSSQGSTSRRAHENRRLPGDEREFNEIYWDLIILGFDGDLYEEESQLRDSQWNIFKNMHWEWKIELNKKLKIIFQNWFKLLAFINHLRPISTWTILISIKSAKLPPKSRCFYTWANSCWALQSPASGRLSCDSPRENGSGVPGMCRFVRPALRRAHPLVDIPRAGGGRASALRFRTGPYPANYKRLLISWPIKKLFTKNI